jgi:Holliday junction resolvasome RuvABC endonuclease subunit
VRRRDITDRPVVGFDLSLRAPAACCVPMGWKLGDWSTLRVETTMVVVDPYDPTVRRLQLIADWALQFCTTPRVAQIYVESYAFSASSSSVTKLAELGGAVRLRLYTAGGGLVMQPLTASFARKLLLGQLPRKGAKLAVQFALKKYGFPKWESDDACDAFAIANAGRAELGLPFLTLA